MDCRYCLELNRGKPEIDWELCWSCKAASDFLKGFSCKRTCTKEDSYTQDEVAKGWYPYEGKY